MFGFLNNTLEAKADDGKTAGGSTSPESLAVADPKREEDLQGLSEKDKWKNGSYVIRIDSLQEGGVAIRYLKESVRDDRRGESQFFDNLEGLKGFLRTEGFGLGSRRPDAESPDPEKLQAILSKIGNQQADSSQEQVPEATAVPVVLTEPSPEEPQTVSVPVSSMPSPFMDADEKKQPAVSLVEPPTAEVFRLDDYRKKNAEPRQEDMSAGEDAQEDLDTAVAEMADKAEALVTKNQAMLHEMRLPEEDKVRQLDLLREKGDQVREVRALSILGNRQDKEGALGKLRALVDDLDVSRSSRAKQAEKKQKEKEQLLQEPTLEECFSSESDSADKRKALTGYVQALWRDYKSGLYGYGMPPKIRDQEWQKVLVPEIRREVVEFLQKYTELPEDRYEIVTDTLLREVFEKH